MRVVVCGIAALLIWGTNASAQRSDDVAVMSAAVQRVLTRLWEPDRVPKGPLRVDRRELEEYMFESPQYPAPVQAFRLGAKRDRRTNAALLKQLRAKSGDIKHASECLGTSKTACRMKDALAVVAVSSPVRRDTVFEVFVEVDWMTGLDWFPVSSARYAVIVGPEGASWAVRQVRLLRIT